MISVNKVYVRLEKKIEQEAYSNTLIYDAACCRGIYNEIFSRLLLILGGSFSSLIYQYGLPTWVWT